MIIININEITSNISAKDQRALFHIDPNDVLAISDVKILVKVVVGLNNDDAIFKVLPITIWTASASPKALPSPKTTPVKIPFFAAGTITL